MGFIALKSQFCPGFCLTGMKLSLTSCRVVIVKLEQVDIFVTLFVQRFRFTR